MTRKREAVIDLMIIGVAKAGTTALFRHLAQSPLVYAHKHHEMVYFLSDYEYLKGWDYACNKYFAGYENGLVVAKCVGQINGREAMIRLRDQFPDVKCIIVLRESAARAYSAYNYAVMQGAEDCPTFEEALALEDERLLNDPRPNNTLLYLRNSTYKPKIEQAFEIFGKDHVLVIYQEEYRKDPYSQLSRVETFIGRPFFEGVEIDFRDHNRAAKARFPWLARLSHRVFKSQNPVKLWLRAMFPHDKALKLRNAVLNLNRFEAPYDPMNESTAREIRKKLAPDRQGLIELIGYCPWEINDF